MEWTTAASITTRMGVKAYSNRYTIQKYWTKAKAFLDIGATQILITGQSAVGKTLLASQLHGRARELSFKVPEQSRRVEIEAITPETWSKLVRILPGQVGHRATAELEHLLGNSELEGIIHVVDYGYSLPREQSIAKALIDDDNIDTIEKLRSHNLQIELDTVKLLFSDIRRLYAQSKRPKWFIIAVNKMDLFPKEREAALSYYHPNGRGMFSEELRLLQRDIGNTNMPIYVLQSCAYEEDFSWNGHVARSDLPRQEQNKIIVNFMKSLATISENDS